MTQSTYAAIVVLFTTSCGASAGEPLSTVDRGDAWRVHVSMSNMSDDTDVLLVARSTDYAQCGHALKTAHLVVGCLENEMAAVIKTPCNVRPGWNEPVDVTYRVDEQPAITRTFAASNGSIDIGADSGAPRFIGEILGARTIRAQFTTFGGDNVEVTFPVGGLKDALTPVRSACGW